MHPRAGVVAVVVSVSGVPVRLTEERWGHILEYHSELAKLLNQILLTVAEPDIVFRSPKDVKENFVAIRMFPELVQYGLAEHLAVHCKEVSTEDGFILTVFPISADRVQKRYRLWRRLK
ncbi:MAG: hypothetical protein ACE5KU_00385 [Nitrososphaerales archaeon]